jgi:hypothetical protein
MLERTKLSFIQYINNALKSGIIFSAVFVFEPQTLKYCTLTQNKNFVFNIYIELI